MPEIRVAKRFFLQHPEGVMTEYVPGIYDVPAEVAAHWYTQAHLQGFAPPPPGPGAVEYAAMMAAKAAEQAGPQSPAQLVPPRLPNVPLSIPTGPAPEGASTDPKPAAAPPGSVLAMPRQPRQTLEPEAA
jgi:hypothetical protein